MTRDKATMIGFTAVLMWALLALLLAGLAAWSASQARFGQDLFDGIARHGIGLRLDRALLGGHCSAHDMHS